MILSHNNHVKLRGGEERRGPCGSEENNIISSGKANIKFLVLKFGKKRARKYKVLQRYTT